MRKIILMMSVSLDGFIEGPNREIDWHLVDDELHSHFNGQLGAMGAFLNGRVTNELMAEFWPTERQELRTGCSPPPAQRWGGLQSVSADMACSYVAVTARMERALSRFPLEDSQPDASGVPSLMIACQIFQDPS